MMSHQLGARSDTCIECSQKYTGLKRHTCKHESVKKYQCEVFGESYPRYSHLWYHKSTKCNHPDDEDTQMGSSETKEISSTQLCGTLQERNNPSKPPYKADLRPKNPQTEAIQLEAMHRNTSTGFAGFPGGSYNLGYSLESDGRFHLLAGTPTSPIPNGKPLQNTVISDNHRYPHHHHQTSPDDLQNFDRKIGKNVSTCQFCNKDFRYPSRLKKHLITHTDEKPEECKYCGKFFRTSGNLKKHVESIHEKLKPFMCPHCKRYFGRQWTVNKHLKVCKKTMSSSDSKIAKDVPTCQFRNKVFQDQSYLKKHLITHTDEKPEECKYCGKFFRTSPNLKIHVKSVHEKLKPFMCPHCKRYFGQQSSVNDHLKVFKKTMSSSDRKIGKDVSTCQFCNKDFRYPSDLKNHLITHTDKKPEECKYCGKFFRKSCHLKDHVKSVHEKLKPFMCPLCKRYFSQKSGAKKHLKVCVRKRVTPIASV